MVVFTVRRSSFVVVLLLAGCPSAATGDDEVAETSETDTADTSETDTGAPICGDGIVDAGEACDDGNQNDADGCLNDCTLPACGDGIVQANEVCDDGNVTNEDACTNLCLANVCGDGFLWSDSEACDDANDVDADGCEADCSLPACGNDIVDPGEICYAEAMTLLVSDNPADVAMADIDDDGNLDLVAGIVGVMPLVAWLGDGNGNLGAAIPSAGLGPAYGIGLQLADLDDDGNLDAIHGSVNEIFVAWGQGDGGFEQPSTIPCPYLAASAVGDFDDDNLLDVACTTIDGDLPPISDVLFALNLGGRNFSGTTTLLPSTFTQPDLATADMDADGDDDVLTYDGLGAIRLFRQTAPATFMLEEYSAPNASGKSIGIGDLDGDERPDVVLSLPGDVQDPTRILPLLQTPGGMLVGQATVVAGMEPSGLVITDVSSDGFLDVVVALEVGSVAVLAGDGAGGLAAPVSFLSGTSPRQVATGNLDGDGVPELAVANYGSTTISVFWSDP